MASEINILYYYIKYSIVLILVLVEDGFRGSWDEVRNFNAKS